MAGPQMDLRKLRHFLTVLETGSLGEAARHLSISQPALSKSIQSLEKIIGSPLFVRSARGVTPTTTARAIEVRARIISAEVDRAEGEIREIQEGRRGRIIVGTGPSFAQSILPRAIGRLLHTSPNVDVVVVDGFIDKLLPAVKAGEVEYALLTLSPQVQDANVDTEILMPRDRVVVVAGSGNPLLSRRNVSLKEIWSGPWVLAKEPDQLRSKLAELFSNVGLPPPHAAVEFSSILLALGALREGNLISFLPELLVRQGLNEGAFGAMRIPELTWERDLGSIFRRGSSFTPPARKLLNEIRGICRRQK
jgi:DNA-binding transcriptional LysR family regulator